MAADRGYPRARPSLGPTGVAGRSGFDDDCEPFWQPLGARKTNELDAVNVTVRRDSGPVPAPGDHTEREPTSGTGLWLSSPRRSRRRPRGVDPSRDRLRTVGTEG